MTIIRRISPLGETLSPRHAMHRIIAVSTSSGGDGERVEGKPGVKPRTEPAAESQAK